MEGQPLLGRRRLPSADVNITVRGRHLAVACVLILGLWRLQAAQAPAHDQPPPVAAGTGPETTSSTPPADEPALAAPHQTAPRAVLSVDPRQRRAADLSPPADLSVVDASRLAAELHRRGYGWEVLSHAGLGPANFTPAEVLRHLRQSAGSDGYRRALRLSSLGLGAFSSAELLLELRARPDLAQAMQATGSGSSTDFECPERDAMPGTAGCQIRCGSRACPPAHAVCAELSHCVGVTVNREGTIATLKSFRVFTPPPTPICDGFAFSEDGGPPVPLAAPHRVYFDDVGTLPQEDWCYRDTGVSQSARAVWAAAAPENSCTMERCFNASRCRGTGQGGGLLAGDTAGGSGMPAGDTARDAGLPSLFLYPEAPPSRDMARWPDCLRQCHSRAVAVAAKEACVVVPTVNVNCEWDQCDPATHQLLRALPSWGEGGGGLGRNHLIWDFNDAQDVKYRTDEAFFVKTSMNIDHYRPGFDVPFPLLPNGVATHATPAELQAADGNRHLLLSFKGVCQGSSLRPRLASLHNGRDVVAVCSGRPAAAQYDYKTLMLTSVFSAAPAGNGLHSYRLAESIFLGAIPVIVDDKLVLPFCQVLDWHRFSVRIPSHRVSELPGILRAIPATTVRQMQARLREVKRRFLLFPFATALALIHLRVMALLDVASGREASGGGDAGRIAGL